MAGVPRLSSIAVAAIVLLGLGATATFATVAWWVETSYGVSVSARDDVEWTLWVPNPGNPMPWTTVGTVAVAGAMTTPYGTLLNLTGRGSADVRFSTGGIGFGSGAFDLAPPVNLSGRQGQWPNGTYAVWRHTSDSAANLSVASGLGFHAARLDESWNCGGSGFVGYLREGWNLLPIRFGDCLGLVSSVPGLIPAALLVPGTVLAVVVRRRGRLERERTGFSPEDASAPRHGRG